MENIKKSVYLKVLLFIAPLFGSFLFILFIVVLFSLDIFGGTGSSGSGNGLVYESECNYEETKVTVVTKRAEVLETISLEDYVLGVLCAEMDVCNGRVANMNEEFIKTQIIIYKTYALSRRSQYNSSTKSITMKASTRDQQWCSLNSTIDNRCVFTTDTVVGGTYKKKNGQIGDIIYKNTYPGSYDQSKFNEETLDRRKTYFTEDDIDKLREYYAETYGELFLPNDFDKVVTSLTYKQELSFNVDVQDFWEEEAEKGKSYEEILISTGNNTLLTDYYKYYQNKSIYRLRDYCAVIGHNNSSESSINYVNWMITIANDNTHGYCQYPGFNIGGVKSKGRTFNPDIDCSSFVYYALLNNGYTSQQLGGSYPFSTSNMGNILKKLGFEELKFDINSLEVGDILWRSGHTEVYIGDGKNVGAHIAETGDINGKPGDQTGKEVSIGSTISGDKPWELVYRKS